MKLIVEKSDIAEYLQPSEVIDFQTPEIAACADFLAKGTYDEVSRAKSVYEFVRDQIPHSFDIKGTIVTCKASEVLKYGYGVCYAKSHLMAALLRYLGIPTGLCYQKLVFSDVRPAIVLHGLNAVYLRDFKKWIRLDARGNKPGVNAQFSVEEEVLAFPVRTELGESDNGTIYACPSPNVITALKKSNTLEELENNLPDEV